MRPKGRAPLRYGSGRAWWRGKWAHLDDGAVLASFATFSERPTPRRGVGVATTLLCF